MAAGVAALALLWALQSDLDDPVRDAGDEIEPVSSDAAPARAPLQARRRAKADRETTPATDAQREEFLGDVSRWRALVAHDAAREAERKRGRKDKTAEQASRKKRAGARKAVVVALRRHPELAFDFLREIERVPQDEVALRMARALQSARSRELEAELAKRATGARTSRERRVALRGLEGRAAAVWLAPVTHAFRADASPEVRDEAAAVLGRSLADWAFREQNPQVRKTLVAELSAEDAEARRRALRALSFERQPDAALLEAVQPLLSDPVPAIRFEAQGILRALEARRAG